MRLLCSASILHHFVIPGRNNVFLIWERLVFGGPGFSPAVEVAVDFGL
jgi:hypothetical protein